MDKLVHFANPYLMCDLCSYPVNAVENLYQSGVAVINKPCGHTAGVTSACPSWGPVDGCMCLKHLGAITHEVV